MVSRNSGPMFGSPYATVHGGKSCTTLYPRRTIVAFLGAIEDGARLPPSTITRVPLDWERHGSHNVVKGLRFSERPWHGGSVVLFSFSKSITRSVSRCLSS